MLGTFWTNPQIQTASDGTLFMYVIGQDCNNTNDCRNASQPPGRHKTCRGHTDMQSDISLFSAPGPLGPWSAHGRVLNGSSNHSAWDNIRTNPAPLVKADGSALLVYRGCTNGCKGYKDEVMGVATAAHWAGPYTAQEAPMNKQNQEDGFVFRDCRGGYHMLAHNVGSTPGGERGRRGGSGAIGIHSFSTDGITWQLSKGAAYTHNVTLIHGSTIALGKRERPVLFFGRNVSVSSCVPSLLLNGVQEWQHPPPIAERGVGVGAFSNTPTYTFGQPILSSKTDDHALQAVVSALARQHGCAISAAVSASGALVAVAAAGVTDRRSGRVSAPSDRYLFGSVAKMYTGAAVLRLVERGILPSLDAAAEPFADRALAAGGNKTQSLRAIFGPTVPCGAPNPTCALCPPLGRCDISRVTLRQLLSMTSGLADFDNDERRRMQCAQPSREINPVEDLSAAAALKWLYVPDTGADYSSTNFVILGLVLAGAATPAVPWDVLDLKAAAIGSAQLADFPATSFLRHGSCKSHGIIDGYATTADLNRSGCGTASMSCTSGWSCGNLASTAAEVAAFTQALFGARSIVSVTSVARMINFSNPLTEDVFEGYGLATSRYNLSNDFHFEPAAKGLGYGHEGETYGFLSAAIYVPAYNRSLAFSMNQEPASNASGKEGYGAFENVRCEVLHVALAGTGASVRCPSALV